MNYAVEVLEKERDILTKCLTEWESNNYPEAKKEREKKLQEINNALKLIS